MSSKCKLQCRDLVTIKRKPTRYNSKSILHGKVAYVGSVSFADGDDWVGVELSGESVGWGKNNGTVCGVEYFRCARKNGLFVRQDAISR